jgi:hypothetical protein
VIRGDAEADQSVGNRVAVEDIDPGIIAVRLFQRLGSVEARRSRTHDREMPHAVSFWGEA